MKRLIIYNDYAYISGGAGKVAFDSAIAFAKNGYDVTFFSGTGPESPLLEKNNIKSICLHQPDMLSDKNKIGAAIRSIWNRKAYKKTLSLLKEYDYNDTAIIVHGFSKTLSTSIFAAFKKTKFKVFLTLHDYFAACPNGGFYNYQEQKSCQLVPMSYTCLRCNCDARSYAQKIYRYIRQIFVRYNLKGNKMNMHALCVSDNSRSLMEPFVKDFFSSYNVLINPVDIYQGDYVNIIDNDYYLFVGRLSEEKGIRDFCRVITELNLKGVVLGEGYLMEEMKLSYPNIVFKGWCNDEQKEKSIKQAKCLIFPSKIHETFGLSVAELLSYGIPCVVSEGLGCTALIYHKQNGLVFQMGNYIALKHCICEFESMDLRNLMDSTRNSFDRSYYTIDNYVKRFKKIVCSV